MKKTDLAYMAGLFDGEGTICIVKPQGKTHRLQISLTSTDEWICQSFRMMFGGNITIKQLQTTNRRQCWIWSANSITAKDMLLSICPYLRIKQPQAQIAIRFQTTIKSSNRRKLSDDQTVVREAESILIKSMNKGKTKN